LGPTALGVPPIGDGSLGGGGTWDIDQSPSCELTAGQIMGAAPRKG
jgi:hypothetical protein